MLFCCIETGVFWWRNGFELTTTNTEHHHKTQCLRLNEPCRKKNQLGTVIWGNYRDIERWFGKVRDGMQKDLRINIHHTFFAFFAAI